MSIKYKWLAGELKEMIGKNIRAGIEKLPTEQELCSRYHVSRQTVRQALAVLEKGNLIVRKQGSGSYITGVLPDQNKNTVAILISDDQEYIYPGVLADIRAELSGNGFTPHVYITGGRTESEYEILLSLLDAPPRGIIAEGCKSALPSPNLDLYRRLMKKGTGLVFLHNYYPALTGSLYIKDDNIAGSAMLVRHLAEQGHTSIGGIFKTDDLQSIERYQGFIETMRSLHLNISDEKIGWFDSRDQFSLEKEKDSSFLRKIAEEALSSCTAVVCYNDMIAFYLLRELRLAGYHLPEDMAVAAFDNTYLSNYGPLSITTLSHKPHEMGTLAAMTMVRRLKGLPASPQEVPWKLNLKGSTNFTV